MGFYLYTGNKLEKLAELFREQVYARQADETAWLTPETVVIQTQGMGAWLKLELAKSAPLAAEPAACQQEPAGKIPDAAGGAGADFR